MTPRNDTAQQSKISPEFSARLARLGPRHRVRAIVMLHTKDVGTATIQRRSHADRQVAIEAIRQSAKQALANIDTILVHYGGKRLANVDALGSIPIETTAAGIRALASSEHVKVMFEDQPISLLAQ